MKFASIAIIALVGLVSAEEVREMTIAEKLNEIKNKHHHHHHKAKKAKGKKESDDLANGDKDDDKEVESEGDPDDDIVDENGLTQLRLQAGDEREELCDGDNDDNRQLEDEADPEDDIADDNGFVDAWRDDRSYIQVGNQLRIKEKKESDELCDGDKADDKELEDEADPEDCIVDDNGFVDAWRDDRSYIQTGSRVRKYSDELANGDSMDDRDIHEDEDMNDDVVDVNGHTNAGYGSMEPSRYVAQNHIRPGTHITEPRNLQLSERNLLQLSDDISSDDTKAQKKSAGQLRPAKYWRELHEMSQAKKSADKYL